MYRRTYNRSNQHPKHADAQRAQETTDPEEKKLYNWLSVWKKTHLKKLVDLHESLLARIWEDNSFSLLNFLGDLCHLHHGQGPKGFTRNQIKNFLWHSPVEEPGRYHRIFIGYKIKGNGLGNLLFGRNPVVREYLFGLCQIHHGICLTVPEDCSEDNGTFGQLIFFIQKTGLKHNLLVCIPDTDFKPYLS